MMNMVDVLPTQYEHGIPKSVEVSLKRRGDLIPRWRLEGGSRKRAS
jgi:hypothetical protein